MRYFVTVGKRTHEIVIDRDEITIDGESVSADLRRVSGTERWSLLLDGRSFAVEAHRGEENGTWRLTLPSGPLLASVVDRATRVARSAVGSPGTGPKPVAAPMPGLVVRVEVEPGDEVETGQGLVIVEAMKMENELRATGPARVRAVRVAAGQSVEKGEILVELDPLPAPDAVEP